MDKYSTNGKYFCFAKKAVPAFAENPNFITSTKIQTFQYFHLPSRHNYCPLKALLPKFHKNITQVFDPQYFKVTCHSFVSHFDTDSPIFVSEVAFASRDCCKIFARREREQFTDLSESICLSLLKGAFPAVVSPMS